MKSALWSRNNRRLIIAAVVLAGGAAVLSGGLMRPAPFPYPDASVAWQCNRTAGVLTVCTQAPRQKVFDSSKNAPVGGRKV
jgi:hypothetical protein